MSQEGAVRLRDLRGPTTVERPNTRLSPAVPTQHITDTTLQTSLLTWLRDEANELCHVLGTALDAPESERRSLLRGRRAEATPATPDSPSSPLHPPTPAEREAQRAQSGFPVQL